MANINELVKEIVIRNGVKYYIIDNEKANNGVADKREIVFIIGKDNKFEKVGFRDNKGDIKLDEVKAEEIENTFIKKKTTEEQNKEKNERPNAYMEEKKENEKQDEPNIIEKERFDPNSETLKAILSSDIKNSYKEIRLAVNNNGKYEIQGIKNGEKEFKQIEEMQIIEEDYYNPIANVKTKEDLIVNNKSSNYVVRYNGKNLMSITEENGMPKVKGIKQIDTGTYENGELAVDIESTRERESREEIDAVKYKLSTEAQKDIESARKDEIKENEKDGDIKLQKNDKGELRLAEKEQAKQKIEAIDKELENTSSLNEKDKRARLLEERKKIVKDYGLEDEEEYQKLPGENSGPNSKQ